MMFPDQRHPAFFRHTARAKIHELAAAQAPAAQAGKLRVLARRELEDARAVATDPRGHPPTLALAAPPGATGPQSQTAAARTENRAHVQRA